MVIRRNMGVLICNRMMFLLGLLMHTLHFSSAMIPSNYSQAVTDSQILEKWNKIDKGLMRVMESIVKNAMPYLIRYSSELNLTSKCVNDGMRLMMGLRKAQPWAVRFLDSSAKIINGMFSGNLVSFGVYDECIDTVEKDKYGKELIRGQYCTVNFRPPVPYSDSNFKLESIPDVLRNMSEKRTIMGELAKIAGSFNILSMRLGICLPSKCELEDVNKMVKLVGDMIYFDAVASRCEVKKELKFNKTETGVIIIYALFGLLAFVGTSVDIYSSKMKIIFRSTGSRVLLAFSLPANFKKIVSTKSNSSSLTCLHGIRFFSTTWVLLGHSYYIINFYLLDNLNKALELSRGFAFQAVVNATFVVDTFFCIGGLLVSYLTIKHVVENGQKFRIPVYILHRIWRILPLTAFVMTIIFILDKFGSGPVWHETVHNYIEDCYDNWWSNLIFINNFYRTKNMCLPHTWYIACDVQLYIAASIILLTLFKKPKLGLVFAFLGLLGCIVYSGVFTYVKNLPPAMLVVHPDPRHYKHYWTVYYFKPFPHIGAYCIGIIAGYLLATKPKLKIPWAMQILGWSLASVFCISTLYGTFDWNQGKDYTVLETVAYACFSKSAWSLGIAWMIVCCASGHGGIVNRILSWKLFIPLGRLSFVVYMLHPFVQIAFIGNFTTSLQTDHFMGVWIFFGHLFITYAVSVIICMLVEAPFLTLGKIMFSQPESNLEKKDNDDNKGALRADKNGCISKIVRNVSKEPETGDEGNNVVYKHDADNNIVYKL